MSVTVLEPRKLVRVAPAEPSVADVLEYAEALIEYYGYNDTWSEKRKAERDAAIAASPDTVDDPPPYGLESNEEVGYTLHDSIGEANERLFPQSEGGNGKEGFRLSTGETTRIAATKAVMAVAGDDPRPKPTKKRGQPEPAPLGAWDDKAYENTLGGRDDVLAVLRQAREGVTA